MEDEREFWKEISYRRKKFPIDGGNFPIIRSKNKMFILPGRLKALISLNLIFKNFVNSFAHAIYCSKI